MLSPVKGGLLALLVSLLQATEWKGPLFSFFSPTVELGDSAVQRIRNGHVVTDTIEATGHELAVFAAGTVDITPDVLVSRIQNITALRQSRFVPAIARFSDPPTLDDLAGLTLDEEDMKALANCRPGDCGLKLAAPEIQRIRAALADAGSNGRSAALNAFREILLERVRTYLSGGLPALPPYHDKRVPLEVAQAFDGLLRHSTYLQRMPRFRTMLLGRRPESLSATSFLYWAVEDFGRRPVIRVTHVVIVRPDRSDLPAVLVGAIQVYASHYIDAALGVTALERPSNHTAYLGYLYKSRVDVLGNFVARWIVEGRLRDEVEKLFTLQLRRLEAPLRE